MQWLFATPIKEFNLSAYATPTVISAILNMQHSYNNAVQGIRVQGNPAHLPECAHLYAKFQECIDEYSSELGFKRNVIHESWANILYKNGSVNIHRHHNSVVSGAFYPHVESQSAPLVFVSPLDGYRMIDLTQFTTPTSYAANIHQVDAHTGKLVLFPSWLQHHVPHNESALRVTLSFNTQFVG